MEKKNMNNICAKIIKRGKSIYNTHTFLFFLQDIYLFYLTHSMKKMCLNSGFLHKFNILL